MTSSVEGCTVSPRKSRRKSACFSRTTTSMPARARRTPSIIPAGPPPAMQQRVFIRSSCNDRSIRAVDRSLKLLLRFVDEAFDRTSWHGTNLRGSLRGVSARLAAHRPARGRHNIWEVTVHAAYWKYAVRRRLTGEKRGSFTLEGSNWFLRPVGKLGAGHERGWKDDVRLLIDQHRKLRAAIADLPARALERPVRGKRHTAAYTIRGIAAHDLYHAGQIQLLKRLHPRR